MTRIYKGLTDLIGKTPLILLSNYGSACGLQAKILGKLEFYNPAGSVKDRIAHGMIADAEARGILTPGSVIIEPTSGNTGIGLAAVGTAKSYRVILTMPETMSIERRKLLAAYGAEVVLTDGTKGMAGSIDRAEQLRQEIPGGVILGQFFNPANPVAHESTTGPEIWEDTGGKVDILVAGIGSGGTISGTGRYLKKQNNGIRVIGVEPAGSPVLSGGKAGPHKIQGIGAGFVPQNLDRTVYDEIIPVPDEEAFVSARLLAKTEGLLAGISSGAALWAAAKLGKRPENAGKHIVVILPDGGERYLSV